MNWSRRSIVLLVWLAILAGCATASPDGGAQSSSSPRVRCLSDPVRDDRSTSRPLIFLFCVESP